MKMQFSIKSKRAKITQIVGIFFSRAVFAQRRHKMAPGKHQQATDSLLPTSLSSTVVYPVRWHLRLLPSPPPVELLPCYLPPRRQSCGFAPDASPSSFAERLFHTGRCGGHARAVMCGSAAVPYTYPGSPQSCCPAATGPASAQHTQQRGFQPRKGSTRHSLFLCTVKS